MVIILCQQGANKDLQDNNGSTALIYAVEYQHFEVAEQLVKLNADLNVKNKVRITLTLTLTLPHRLLRLYDS